MVLSTPFPKQKQVYLQPSGYYNTGCSHLCRKRNTYNGGGRIFRSDVGQLRENGSTSAAPQAATSRYTFSRQHRPKCLSILQRNIHLIDFKYCEDTRPQKDLGLDSQRVQKLASKLHVHSVNYAANTVPTSRTLIGTLAAKAFWAPQAPHRNLPGMIPN